MTVLLRWSRRTFADMVRAGREWEEETSLPNRRRRVPSMTRTRERSGSPGRPVRLAAARPTARDA